MEQRPLGRNGPLVSVVCLGAWPLGGGMGDIPERQAIATIHAALDAGMTFIDTAESYRSSEAVIGKALQGRRDRAFVATKLSGSHAPEHLARAIESSLRALHTDHVDLYQLHGPDPSQPIADTMANLMKLRDQGKIRYIGVSNFSGAQTREAIKYGTVHSSQPRYSMMFRDAEREVLPTCLEAGIGVIAHSPLAKGLLTGKYRPGHQFPEGDERGRISVFDQQKVARAWEAIPNLQRWAEARGRDLVQLAIAWTLSHPSMTSSIVGAKTPEQVKHNARAADWRLSKDDVAELETLLGGLDLSP
ncbi:MAG: aldo/keto reductase [Chloroflexi bacterium]|nr:aldo/keto reductase [Chloroflexota bacterium]